MISTAWALYNGANPEDLGLLPMFLTDENPAGAVEQIDSNYGHGGGWQDFDGFKLTNHEEGESARLEYPGDPALWPMASTKLRDETVILFECSWVAVVQPDGKFRVARID